MEDRTRMFFHNATVNNGKESHPNIKTDKVTSPENREVQREFEAAANETTGSFWPGEGSGSGATTSVNGKKRGRGRPRKHEGDSNVRSSGVFPPPTASSVPSSMPPAKRSRGRPKGTGKFQALASNGGGYLDTAGASFTPHVLEGFPGEDIVTKIKSLCFQSKGSRSVCILTATGVVSSVTMIRTGSVGTLTYEGWYQILTLSGSFVISHDDAGTPCFNSWNLSGSLADNKGEVFGGKIVGPLIAAGPGSIQLVVGSFKPDIGSDIKRKYSTGRSSSTSANHFGRSSMLVSQVSGLASPRAPHILIKEDPLKLTPSKSDNIVAENRHFNSSSVESVGPKNLQKADTVIAENHDLNSLQKEGLMPANNVTAAKSVGPNNFLPFLAAPTKSD